MSCIVEGAEFRQGYPTARRNWHPFGGAGGLARKHNHHQAEITTFS
jgi:hypothetical protein